jgi:hypothetical protein
MNRIKEALGEKGIKQTWLAEKSIVFLQALYKRGFFYCLFSWAFSLDISEASS